MVSRNPSCGDDFAKMLVPKRKFSAVLRIRVDIVLSGCLNGWCDIIHIPPLISAYKPATHPYLLRPSPALSLHISHRPSPPSIPHLMHRSLRPPISSSHISPDTLTKPPSLSPFLISPTVARVEPPTYHYSSDEPPRGNQLTAVETQQKSAHG
jgi:hypothetical protein